MIFTFGLLGMIVYSLLCTLVGFAMGKILTVEVGVERDDEKKEES